MILTGAVNGRREAMVCVRLRGPTGVELPIDGIVDTGFGGHLTLPITIVAALGLAKRTTGNARLGDGSPRGFDVYAADIWWDDRWQAVYAAALGREPLIDMRLVDRQRLTIDGRPNGAVSIVPLGP